MAQRFSASMSYASCRRRPAALVAGAEEERLDQIEVAFGLHALEEHRADHAAPTNQSREFHRPALS
jgi:hypothetical protein